MSEHEEITVKVKVTTPFRDLNVDYKKGVQELPEGTAKMALKSGLAAVHEDESEADTGSDDENDTVPGDDETESGTSSDDEPPKDTEE